MNNHHIQSLERHIASLDAPTFDAAMRGIARYLYEHGVDKGILTMGGLDDLLSYIERGCTTGEANAFRLKIIGSSTHYPVINTILLISDRQMWFGRSPTQGARKEDVEYIASALELVGVQEIYNVFGSLLGMQTLMNRIPTKQQVQEMLNLNSMELMDRWGDDLISLEIPENGDPRLAVTMVAGTSDSVPEWIDLELDGITYLVPIECRESDDRAILL